jgi:CCR4-NOT transcription complex subunit 1
MPPMPAKGTVPAPSNGASSSGSTLGTPADKPGVATSSSNGTGKKPPGPREAEGSGGGGSGAGGGGLPLPTPGTIGTVEQPTTHSPPPSPLRPAGNSMSGGGGSVVTPPSPAKGSGFHMGASLPLETITNAIKQVPPPDEAIKDKIIFVFNNVSKQNMEGKVNELKALLGTSREAWQYLAQHLVVHRASIEPNFHALYLEFLTALKIPKLITMVLSSTYAAIKALLRSPRIVSVAAERTLLKNLGSWLGSITLARNKPLIHKQLALKARIQFPGRLSDLLFQELILEAYEKGRLLAVIPFAAKILESCAKSKIFAPPNVWVMAIMRLLAEIYHMPDLKLNLKFEIELLCNHLALDLNGNFGAHLPGK